MDIHLPNDVILVPTFRFSDKESEWKKDLEKWLNDLVRAIEDYFKKTYYDFSMGRSQFTVFTTEPTTGDLSEGQIGLYGNHVYTVVESTLRRVSMEEVQNANVVCRLNVRQKSSKSMNCKITGTH